MQNSWFSNFDIKYLRVMIANYSEKKEPIWNSIWTHLKDFGAHFSLSMLKWEPKKHPFKRSRSFNNFFTAVRAKRADKTHQDSFVMSYYLQLFFRETFEFHHQTQTQTVEKACTVSLINSRKHLLMLLWRHI